MISRNNRTVAAVCFATGLAACSSDGSSERAVEALRELATRPFQTAQEIRVPTDRPYVILSYGAAKTPMSLQTESDGIAQYSSPGGVEMTLNNGLLARLRRLGQEYEAFYVLEGGEYRGNLLELSRSGIATTRVMVYWIDQKPYRDRMRCTFSFDKVTRGLRQFSERCQSLYKRLEIENTYWTDRNGTLLESRQWFHPDALSVEIDHRRRAAGR